MITLADIQAAQKKLPPSIMLSPLRKSDRLSARLGCECYIKYENLQKTGSFKGRGASVRLAQLTPEERKRGVICASAGNHAQGVAYHATELGIDSTIVMPEGTPLVKVERTKSFGGRVVLYGTTYEDAFAEAKRLEQEEGRIFVHPFDDDAIIAGQGTVGLEILDQMPDVEAVVVAIGGGGLASGIAVAIKSQRPSVKIYGVETLQLPSMLEALRNGTPVTLPAARTLAEGIAVRRAGDKTLEIAKKYIDDIVLVDDEEIAEAILVLLEQEKAVAEGAGAAPLAALLQHRLPIEGKKVCVVLCGGNIDVNLLSRIIERGLVKSGRVARFRVKLADVAGSLAALTTAVAKVRASVLEIAHDRTFSGAGVNEVAVDLVLETRGFDHIAELTAHLHELGYDASQI